MRRFWFVALAIVIFCSVPGVYAGEKIPDQVAARLGIGSIGGWIAVIGHGCQPSGSGNTKPRPSGFQIPPRQHMRVILPDGEHRGRPGVIFVSIGRQDQLIIRMVVVRQQNQTHVIDLSGYGMV